MARRSVSTRPRPARQHFFFNFAFRFRVPRRAPVSRSGGVNYPDPPRPVNTFFQPPGESFSPGPRCRLAVTRRSVSTPARRHRQHLFSTSPAAPSRRRPCPGLPKRRGSVYPDRTEPSTPFFQSFREPVVPGNAPPRFPAAGVAVYADQVRPSTSFSTPCDPIDAKSSPNVSVGEYT